MTTPTRTDETRQGRLWGAAPRDWAESEERQAPTYATALDRLGVSSCDRVLDAGCGAGTFLAMAAARGAETAGIDISAGMIEIARERLPGADLRIGDLAALPWDEDEFDAVCGFNSFFFAADMTAALREAGRVARPGAPVLIQVWGRAERCALVDVLGAIAPLRSGERKGPGPSALSQPGLLEGMSEEAGLRPEAAFDHSYAFEYADEAAFVRAMLAAGSVVDAVETSGAEAVTAALAAAASPHRDATGTIRLENEWHYLIARA